jgi:hypothetical protein
MFSALASGFRRRTRARQGSPDAFSRRSTSTDHYRSGLATYALVTAESTGRGQPRLYRDCRGVATGNWEQLNLRLVADLNRNAIDQYKGFAAHSGVIGVNCHAIALPAESKGGKSTLTAAAVREGFTYVSDESLCLDLDTARVEPYPKPITPTDSCRLLGLKRPKEERGHP